MNLTLFIYLADVLDKVATISAVLSFFTGFGVAFLVILYLIARSDKREIHIAKGLFFGLKVCGSIFAVSLPLALFVPSKNTMYLMAGGYAAQEVATSDVGVKVMTIINQELDKMLEVGK